MERSKSLQLAFLAAVCLAVQLPTAHAAIVISGNVDPADPNDWNSNTIGYVGNTAAGELEVNGGSELASHRGYIGYEDTATGQVVVTGSGSTWHNSDYLYVGYLGGGTLKITGGAVSNSDDAVIGFLPDSTGAVTVDGARSTWHNSDKLYVGYQGSGTLNITGGAEVSNSSRYASGYIGRYSGSTGVVTVDGAGSTWYNRVDLYVGYEGSGTLNITGGAEVSNPSRNSSSYIGHQSGSTSVVTVDGAGSTWNNSRLYVGHEGSGTLNITGGAVSNSWYGFIGFLPDSTGVVTVDGAGSTWNNSDNLYVGYEGHGTLNITGGAVSNSDHGYIGLRPDSTGVVTVDGAGSTWSNSGHLMVGDSGSGTLNITGGAHVSAAGYTYVAYGTGSTGLIHFGPGGGTLTTRSLCASPTELTGTGTINTRGLVSDIDVVFDSAASLTQDLILDSEPGQNVTIYLDMASDPSSNGILGAGWKGHGSLAIRDGVTVYSDYGYIGRHSGSTGVVTVDGAGSTWNNSDELSVGNSGSGTLNITGGAAVSNSRGYIGRYSGSTGVVTVDGAGSTWTTNSDRLYVGLSGNGTLNITGGADVSAAGYTYVAYGTGSTGLIHFGPGGGTLTTRSLCASPTELTGTGTINTRGLVSDVDVVFDSTASLTQDLILDSEPGQNVTVHFDMASDPSSNGDLGAGWKGHGSLVIRDGVTVNSDYGYIGRHSDSTGVVTVDGAGSTWNNSDELRVGYSGSGTLNVTGGAAVSNSRGYIGTYSLSTGVVTVDGAGSTWNNGENLYVGFEGNGTLNVTDGAVSNSDHGYIGVQSDSTGVVTVDGAGSTWNNSYLYVGYSGSGTLNITGGAAVSNSHGYIGTYSASTSGVTVDGAGSAWNSSGGLYVGNSGSATLHVTGGGDVSAESVSINNESLLAIDVGNGSLLQIDGGSRTITNDGKVRILAGARATAGNVYEPIAATTWHGSGVYQAVGGTWDEADHQFTVSGVESGTSGSRVTIDRSQTQRLLIDDGQTDWSVGVSFLAADSASDLHLTATAVSGSTLADLESLLDAGDSVLGGWLLTVDGAYAEGDPAYLSFDVGEGFSRGDLSVWHFDGADWAAYLPADLTHNGTYASFTVTGFSGYAVTTVPEPGTLAILLTTLAAMALWWRKPRRHRFGRTAVVASSRGARWLQ